MITLQTGGLKVDLEVVDYKPNNRKDLCRMNFHVYGNGIDIQQDAMRERLSNSELEMLTYCLEQLLQGTSEGDFIDCVYLELFFEIVLKPYKGLRVYASIGQSDLNKLDLQFNIGECKKLYNYLIEDVGVIVKTSPEIEQDDENEIDKTYRYVKVVYNPDDVREYSYLDENRIADYDSYVWVPVGKDNKQKIAFVVEFEDYTADKVPFPLDKVKKILRLATDEEVAKIESDW